MQISNIKQRALQGLNGKWGLGILASLTLALVSILSFVAEIVATGGFKNYWEYQSLSLMQTSELTYEQTQSLSQMELRTTVSSGIVELLAIPLTIGVMWFFLGLIRSENPKVRSVFNTYRSFGNALKLLGASIVQGIFIFLWSLLLIIPGIIKSLSYSQLFFILKDNPDMPVLDAITESRRLMDGNKGTLFLLYLSFIGWGILSILTLGIGFIWLTPYIYAAQAAFYDELVSGSSTDVVTAAE